MSGDTASYTQSGGPIPRPPPFTHRGNSHRKPDPPKLPPEPEEGWTEKAIAVWGKLEQHERTLFHSDLWKSRPQSESVLEVVRFMYRKLNLDDLLSMATWPDGFGMEDYRIFHLKCAREQWEVLDEPKAKEKAEAAFAATLAAQLDVHTWATVVVPKEERLLGELITPGTGTFLIGTTGVGKTMLGHEMVATMAAETTKFLHWTCDRPSRWLVVDGEMPTPLIKMRTHGIRARHNILPGNMLIYSAGRAVEFAKLIPGIGEMPPLTTPEGHAWVMRLATVLRVDGTLFDNLMSLSPGDHSKPDAWLATLPLVSLLSKEGIAQIWCDHTGWDVSRQYGASTKAWQMDTAGVMKPLPEDQRQPNETAFTLTFEPPGGKCRRRTPDNWRDFQTHVIRFSDGRWTSEQPIDAKELSPKARGWLKDIANIFTIPDVAKDRTVNVAGVSCVRFCIRRDELRWWLRKCGRIGAGGDANLTGAERTKLNDWLNTLRDAGKIGIDGDHMWLTSGFNPDANLT